jgi:predicted RNase H-like HicB family nuclease
MIPAKSEYLIRLFQDPEEDEGYWVVEVLDRSGCVSQGKTREEALANIAEALALYEESADPPNTTVTYIPMSSTTIDMHFTGERGGM